MYPHISELLEELHRREISTFLVTNAQFPDAIKSLPPVTQLYVSIDAATKDSLKAVDRPLFKDFWERFISSLRALKNKGQRTVYRLTLVKGWNMQEVKSYVDLIDIGTPELIEIKGVTYCGTSAASSLTMENVPWHEEVVAFATAIAEATGGRYGLACEHKHSCCILLADKSKYLRDGRWHTWIDYPAFHALVKSGKPFTSAEYCAPTPEWAVFGAPEAGFDPVESRHYRNGKGKLEPVEYEASSSGCG
jgi:tRNA wybutosine-synthesizing protein 1